MTMSLKDLQRGRLATVMGLDASPSVQHRLMEMGFVPGTSIEIVNRGTPSLIRLHGGRISLSAELARVVRVAI